MDTWTSRIYFLGTFVSFVQALSQSKIGCGPDLECSLDVYCCELSKYFCCDYTTFNNHTHGSNDDNNASEDGLLRMGLKSALVLLILSSAIFLLCFCVMRCCQRAGLRSSNSHRGGSLGDYGGVHGRMDSLSARLSSRTFNLLSRSFPRTSTGMDDEPPSYSEVFEAGTTFDVQVEIETEKPPPEYSSIVKEECVAEEI